MSNENKKYQKSEVQAQEKNPFFDDLYLNMKTGKRTQSFISSHERVIDLETGEHKRNKHVRMGVSKVVDKEEFVKFFAGGLTSVLGLSKTAQDLFIQVLLPAYLAQKMTAEKIYINFAMAQSEYSYAKSQTTFKNGINQLQNNSFIVPIANMPSWFWINPTMFFKGDRISIVNDYVLEGSEAEKQLNLADKKLEERKLIEERAKLFQSRQGDIFKE